MYRNCIFCSAALGSNDALERFPVGRTLAFDGEKGRLWTVCRTCARWNLAPIEERWEAIEEAERLFHDSSTRAQSENVGLARLRDGTRLVRIGGAPRPEIATWRYGRMLRRNALWNRVYLAAGPAMLLGSLLPVVGSSIVAPAAVAGLMVLMVRQENKRHERAESVALQLNLPAETGLVPVYLRWKDFASTRVFAGQDGALTVEVLNGTNHTWRGGEPFRLTGAAAHAVVSRAMAGTSHRGADENTLRAALELTGDGGVRGVLEKGGADGFSLLPPDVGLRSAFPTFRRLAGGVEEEPPRHTHAPRLGPETSLALEMALNEETERRAMEGELAALEAMWREAEQVAAIADSLPDVPSAGLPRLTLPG